MPQIEGTRRFKECKGEYDFAVDGGAISTITMRASSDDAVGNTIPAGSYIEGGFIEVLTLLTSGGAGAVAINSEGAGDVLASAVVSGAPWSTTGIKSITEAFTGATGVKTTVARSLAATIAAAALTAGKFRVVVFYR